MHRRRPQSQALPAVPLEPRRLRLRTRPRADLKAPAARSGRFVAFQSPDTETGIECAHRMRAFAAWTVSTRTRKRRRCAIGDIRPAREGPDRRGHGPRLPKRERGSRTLNNACTATGIECAHHMRAFTAWTVSTRAVNRPQDFIGRCRPLGSARSSADTVRAFQSANAVRAL